MARKKEEKKPSKNPYEKEIKALEGSEMALNKVRKKKLEKLKSIK